MQSRAVLCACLVSACGDNRGAAELDAGADITAVEGAPVSLRAVLSGAQATAITWDFGDGETVEDTLEPTHEFVNNGVFEVRVTADQLTDTVVVTVDNAPPTIDLAPGATAWIPGRPYELRALVADPGRADLLTATLDWGDGTRDIVPASALVLDQLSAAHVYTEDAIPSIAITIEDGDGGRATASRTIDVRPRELIFAEVSLPRWTMLSHSRRHPRA